MVLLTLYAVIVWYLAALYRRRWAGYAAVLSSLIPIAVITSVLARVDVLLGGTIQPSGAFLILLAEAVLTLAVGGFIVLLPARRPTEYHCARCHYDLRGLLDPGEAAAVTTAELEPQGWRAGRPAPPVPPPGPPELTCPECGSVWTRPAARPPLVPIPDPRTSVPMTPARRRL